jgi:hypothetical protein
VLRRHGLYSSHLTKWRQERKSGILEVWHRKSEGRSRRPIR